ncbi:MAG: hypothetical protein AAF705_20350, partial [Bacteroidota bacterium]
ELAFLQRVFKRVDSYNPWTAEGTENHISMSRCSGYLYAQLAKQKYPDQFPEASLRMEQMKTWMTHFSKKILETGTGEWNSSIYGPYNILPWVNVYDFAVDPEVKAMAKVVLDYYAIELALHYAQGLTGGSDMRGKGNTRSFKGSTAYLGWLWYGDSLTPFTTANLNLGARNATHVAQIVHAATSTYRPNPLMVNLVQSQGMYYNSKGNYLLGNPSYIKQTFFKASDYSLGAAYLPYGGWGGGDFQIVSWKLLSKVNPGPGKSIQYLSGIGMLPPNGTFSGGHMRSPFDQLVHHENVLIQLTRVPKQAEQIAEEIKNLYGQWHLDWAIDFQKRFPNDAHKLGDNPVNYQTLDHSKNRSSLILHPNGKWAQHQEGVFNILDLEKTWVVIQSIRANPTGAFQTFQTKKDTFYFSSVEEEKGKVCGFVLEVIEKKDCLSLQELKDKILPKIELDYALLDKEDRLIYTSSRGDQLDVVYQKTGTFRAPLFDWGYGNEEPMIIPSTPPIRQPEWPEGEGHGKIARWEINGEFEDLSSRWPVYGGPQVEIGKHQLYLFDQEKEYRIDFTGSKPVFSNN